MIQKNSLQRIASLQTPVLIQRTIAYVSLRSSFAPRTASAYSISGAIGGRQ